MNIGIRFTTLAILSLCGLTGSAFSAEVAAIPPPQPAAGTELGFLNFQT
jgi:hypothetical protein